MTHRVSTQEQAQAIAVDVANRRQVLSWWQADLASLENTIMEVSRLMGVEAVLREDVDGCERRTRDLDAKLASATQTASALAGRLDQVTDEFNQACRLRDDRIAETLDLNKLLSSQVAIQRGRLRELRKEKDLLEDEVSILTGKVEQMERQHPIDIDIWRGRFAKLEAENKELRKAARRRR